MFAHSGWLPSLRFRLVLSYLIYLAYPTFFGSQVQLALLTATVKLFLRRPEESDALLKQVFKWCTEDVDNPDLRDRGFMYWRLLSADPRTAKAVVLADRPLAANGSYDSMEPSLLNELIAHIGSLSSVFHKPPHQFIATTVKASRAAAAAAVSEKKTSSDDVEIVPRSRRDDDGAPTYLYDFPCDERRRELTAVVLY